MTLAKYLLPFPLSSQWIPLNFRSEIAKRSGMRPWLEGIFLTDSGRETSTPLEARVILNHIA